MRKTRTAILIVTLLCCLALAGVTLTNGMFADEHGVPWDARYGGGGLTSSANYAINGTVGQAAIGWATSEGHRLGTGFCYGLRVPNRIYLPLVIRETQ